MEYNAIFEITYGSSDCTGVYPLVKCEFSKFFSHNDLGAMRAAYHIAQNYIVDTPLTPFNDDISVKILELRNSRESINQKHMGIAGYFEDDCLVVKGNSNQQSPILLGRIAKGYLITCYSGLNKIFDISKN